ncbi:MAG: PilZ domain-containing protein, partial [Nevskiales bacterium]
PARGPQSQEVPQSAGMQGKPPQYVMSPSKHDPMATMPLRGRDRRVYWRFHLPVSVLVQALWGGKPLALTTDTEYENISAVGATLALARGPRPGLGERVELRLPLAERPSDPERLWAFCRGRVVRHDGEMGFAVYFEDVEFYSEQPVQPSAAAHAHA